MIIENDKVILENNNEEYEFRPMGCDNCDNKEGCETKPVKLVIIDSEEDDFYDVHLCHQCICAHCNGEELDTGCNNRFKI